MVTSNVKDVDYSLYLVIDSTSSILRGRDLCTVVQQALQGGVTIVQYRDKTSDTAHLVKTAEALHKITLAAGVPLLINDRADVAVAIGAEGVHIGQGDLSLGMARKMLGQDAIIGVTVSSIEEAEAAVRGGADYLGIGTVFATTTKVDVKSIIGPAGVRDILQSPAVVHSPIKTVCIGGINAANVQRVLAQSTPSPHVTPRKQLDGVAVISAIISADDPQAAAERLRDSALQAPAYAKSISDATVLTNEIVSKTLPKVVKSLSNKKPLCHNITNLVVQNIAANVAICVGSSPIMANEGVEAADLAKLGGSLVINMGTVTPEMLGNYKLAIQAYNAVGGPIVLDPVGAAATQTRRDTVKKLMTAGYFHLIKGNESEIKTVAGTGGGSQQQGVDSGPSTLDLKGKAKLVGELAAKERNVVLMTGAVDVLSDGQCTFAVSNGHELLGDITGSGCTLGTTAASYLAVYRERPLLAVLAALLHFEIAAERAADRTDSVRGPGTFVPAWLDELYLIKKESARGDWRWLERARYSILVDGEPAV